MKIKKLLLTFLIGLIFLPSLVIAETTEEPLFISPNYDIENREETDFYLLRKGISILFYVEKDWWNSLTENQKSEVNISIRDLDFAFKFDIKPALNRAYGMEVSPGLDNENRIVVAIHKMKDNSLGYFRSANQYPQYQVADSNEHEMVYLNADYIADDNVESYLAHEFTHLITFNQKDQYATTEETWLNEARAEYAPTIVGYNNEYRNSYLEERVNDFLKEPSDSITEWQGEAADYGALTLFTHYLVDHYGEEILKDSLQSRYTGIESINKALEENGIEKSFSDIFTDWTIAIAVNDCSLGEKYCYLNKNLKDVDVVPLINFLPLSGRATLGTTQETKDWAGNWFKFIGGKGTLRLEFVGETEQDFVLPYIIKTLSGDYNIDFLDLNNFQRGVISIPEFGTNVGSITIIPSIQSKTANFDNSETAYPFFWEVSTAVDVKEENVDYLDKAISLMTKEELLDKISELDSLLSQLSDQVTKIEMEEEVETVLCQSFDENLYFGLTNNSDVSCLQQFLRTQEGIYPEGLVTGNFYTLTQQAVIRFQEKYREDVLEPYGLEKGTGFVGPSTREKLNELLGI
jgi:peptidoglycan hydrolase-like protein with peptidoglycan-binding domain